MLQNGYVHFNILEFNSVLDFFLYTPKHFFFSICIGGVFKLELFLPEEYPMAAPKVCQVSLAKTSFFLVSQNPVCGFLHNVHVYAFLPFSYPNPHEEDSVKYSVPK